MPHYLLSIELTEDERPIYGFPYIKSLEIEDQQPFDYQAEPTVDQQGNPVKVYKTAPPTRLGEIDAVALWTDKLVCLRFNGQIDGDVPLAPDGVVVLFDCVLDDSPITNIQVSRTETPPTDLGSADVRGFAMGIDVYEGGGA